MLNGTAPQQNDRVNAFPIAVLDTADGLRLSALDADDAPALMAAVADAELRRWLPLPSPYTLEIAVAWCSTVSTEMRESGRGFVLGVRRDGQLVASVDAKRVDWRSRVLELSYWTAAAYRGEGIIGSALSRVTTWLIDELAFERVELRISPANAPSLRVAEKAGFVREGTARNAGFTDAGRVDLVVFSRVPSDEDRVR